MQTVGLVLLLSSCCLWTFSGHLIEHRPAPSVSWGDYFDPEHLPGTVAAVGIIVGLPFGAGLLAAGLGLQGDRLGAARVGMAVAAAMTLIYGGEAVWLIVSANLRPLALALVPLAAIGLVLFLLAGHSADVLRRFPPPPDQSVVSDEWIEQYREKRRKKLTVYPSADRWDEFDED